MKTSDTRIRLIDDILRDDEAFHRLQAECETVLMRRRLWRRLRLAALPLAAAVAFIIGLKLRVPVSTGVSPDNSSLNPTVEIAANQSLHTSSTPSANTTIVSIVSTDDILGPQKWQTLAFATSDIPLRLILIDDRELLHLFADRGPMLKQGTNGLELWIKQNGTLIQVR